LKEDKLRLQLRAEMKKHNKKLAGVAKKSGVAQPVDYAIFMDHGYREHSQGSHLIFVLFDEWQLALSAELLSLVQKYKNQM
jgi:hypothetical protein